LPCAKLRAMSEYEHDTALERKRLSDADASAVYKRAMQRFDECHHATWDMRQESLAARRFVTIPGAQWEDEAWREMFQNAVRLEINKTGRVIDKIETDYRENRIVPDFRPDGPQADEETADTLDGLYRADFNRFKSQQALDNAVFEALAGGFGAYRLSNEFDDEYDPENDYQRINPAGLIVDADQSVFFDLAARQYDKSDARFCFVRTAMTVDAFKETFGENKAVSFPEATNWRCRDWFQPQTIGVAEYYEVEETKDKLLILTHQISKEERRDWADDIEPDELRDLKRDGWKVKEQTRKRRRVRKYVMSGAEILEDRGYIAGKCIPIVPVYAKRYFVENIERWKSPVHDKMDIQRTYNAMASRLVETSATSPLETPIFAPEQMPPEIANAWATANVDRPAYLLADAVRDEAGNPVQFGPLGYRKPPELAPVDATILQIANSDLIEDQVDGAGQVRANVSAEAMDIAATRVDSKSGIYLDNIRQSVQRGGEVYLSMATEVYSEDGRVVDTMDEEGGDGQAVLKKMIEGGAVVNDFTHARYKVIVSVSEATATRRDKTVKSMLSTAQVANVAGDQELAQIAILTAVLNQDGEGLKDMQDYARKRLVSLGAVEPTDDEAQAMTEAAENTPPDPFAQVAEAQAADFMASADKKQAELEQIAATAALREAQAIKTAREAGVL
jgi:hypothetical protein